MRKLKQIIKKEIIKILKENTYKPGEKIGGGMTGDTFSVEGHPEYVYKPITNKPSGPFSSPVTKENILKIQQYIKSYPDIYAQIIDVNDNFYIQEKTNTKIFKQDLNNLDKELKKEGKYYYQWYAEDNDDKTPETRALYFGMNVFGMGDNYKEMDNKFFSSLSDKNKELVLKLNSFFKKAKDENLDAHAGNFGYDIEGNIKYFDIT
jgi:hypothetical protein